MATHPADSVRVAAELKVAEVADVAQFPSDQRAGLGGKGRCRELKVSRLQEERSLGGHGLPLTVQPEHLPAARAPVRQPDRRELPQVR